ncbi:MAG: hypothetical protein IJB69_02330 [Clostridia bacterium]|nr:hypothetical protein [Clostridia bacterium]
MTIREYHSFCPTEMKALYESVGWVSYLRREELLEKAFDPGPNCERNWLDKRAVSRWSLGIACNTQKPVCKRRLQYCEPVVAPPPHGMGGFQPPAGCFASGENDKKKR